MQVPDLCLGIIGWGYWGPKLARNLESLPHVRVTMIADLDEQRLQTLEVDHEVNTTTRPEDLLRAHLDGVVIASPVRTHYQLAREALMYGRHVLVEKPLTSSVEEAEHLVELARQRGRTLMVGHTFEYSPAVNAMKQLIERGELGRIYFITMERMNLGLFRDDIDVIWDLATHDISILLYILGKKPISIAGQTYACVRSHLAEVAYIDLSFADGLHVHIHNSWLHPCKTRKITLIGAQKSAIYDDTDPAAPVKVYDRGAYTDEDQCVKYRSGGVYSLPVDKTEPLFLECRDFVRAIRSGQPPRASGEVGLEVVRVLAEAQAICSQKKSLHPIASR